VVVYSDNSIALPLLTAYAREKREARPLKRLYGRRQAMMERLVEEYRSALAFRDERAEESLSHMHPGAGGAETAARR
jgi:deoxyhypusine synthase